MGLSLRVIEMNKKEIKRILSDAVNGANGVRIPRTVRTLQENLL